MDYETLVETRLKSALDIYKEFTLDKANLVHIALGICGEAGELLDTIKKHFAYNKTLDEINLIEELGDLEFYMEALRQHLNLTRDDVIKSNTLKLQKRYTTGYSDKEASLRRDKLNG